MLYITNQNAVSSVKEMQSPEIFVDGAIHYGFPFRAACYGIFCVNNFNLLAFMFDIVFWSLVGFVGMYLIRRLFIKIQKNKHHITSY